jgi:hypothetical protein
MDDAERTHWVETVNGLERSLRRWKLAAGTALAALVLTFLFLGAMNLFQGFRAVADLQRARAAEAAARDAEQMQRQQAESAKRQPDAKQRK